MERFELTVGDTAEGERLDATLASHTPLSRSRCASLIGDGHAYIDGRRIDKSSQRLRAGQTVVLEVPEPEPVELAAQDIPLDVVFEDEELIVVDKPAGMVVHPAPGHPKGTLVNALLAHCDDLAGIGGELRPGIVHRIDRDTSGLLVVAKTERAMEVLQAQFRRHTVDRRYLALAAHVREPALADRDTIRSFHRRHPSDRKRFTGQLESKRRATTHVEVLERFADGCVLVGCRLETGRTHQIRMHLSERGYPLLGDPLYGGRAVEACSLISRTALHAQTLGFDHPGGDRLRFEREPPADFADALERLRAGATWRR